MAAVSLTNRIALCNGVGEQTKLSKGVRITALVVGTLMTLIGVLALVGIPGLNHLGTTVGWVGLSVGIALVAAGTGLKCVTRQNNPSTPVNIPQPDSSALSINLSFGLSSSHLSENDWNLPSQSPISPLPTSNLPEDAVINILNWLDNRNLLAFARASKANLSFVKKCFSNRLKQAMCEEAAITAWIRGIKNLRNYDVMKDGENSVNPFHGTDRFITLLLNEYSKEMFIILKGAWEEIPKMEKGKWDAYENFLMLVGKTAWINPTSMKDFVTMIVDSHPKGAFSCVQAAAAVLGSDRALNLWRTDRDALGNLLLDDAVSNALMGAYFIIKAMVREKSKKLFEFFESLPDAWQTVATSLMIAESMVHEETYVSTILDGCLKIADQAHPHSQLYMLFDICMGYLAMKNIDRAVKILQQMPKIPSTHAYDMMIKMVKKYCDLEDRQYLPILESLNKKKMDEGIAWSYSALDRIKIAHLISYSDPKKAKTILFSGILEKKGNIPESERQSIPKIEMKVALALLLFDPNAALDIAAGITHPAYKLRALIAINKKSSTLADQVSKNIIELKEQVEGIADGSLSKFECLCLLANYFPKEANQLIQKADQALKLCDRSKIPALYSETLLAFAYYSYSPTLCISYVRHSFPNDYVAQARVMFFCACSLDLNSLFKERSDRDTSEGYEEIDNTLLSELI